jgi:hypothetical protein
MPVAIFDGELTSHYDPLLDGSGPPTDQISTDDMATLNGGTHNSEGILFDGTNDDMSSDTQSNGVPITVGGDYTWYMRLKVEAAIGAVNERWMRPTTLSGTKQGPLISPLFAVASIGDFYFDAHASAGFARVILNMGRDFEVGEEVLAVMSQDFSARTITCAMYSKNASANLALSGNGTGTTDPGFAGTDSYLFFNNTSGGFSNVTLLEMGAIDGTFKTEDDLNTAAAAWAAGTANAYNDQVLLTTILS